MVDTRDLKSLDLYRLCGFESRFEHRSTLAFPTMAGRILKSLSLAAILAACTPLAAQNISYNLYIGLGPLKVNAGQASLSSSYADYDGRAAVYTVLSMTTDGGADRIYQLRDTIESYNTPSGESLFYSKRVHEGSKNNLETAVFSQDQGHFIVNLHTIDVNTLKETGKSTQWRDERIYDMLSMLQFARGIDTSDKEPGYTESLPMVNGDMVVQQYLVYEGNRKVRADDGNSYDCLVISVRDWKYEKERETLKAYVTADRAHKPVQLDIAVGPASLKAIMK